MNKGSWNYLESLNCLDLQLFAEGSSEEKTEEATPHRKQEARKKGQVSRSSDLNAAIGMMAMILFLYLIRGHLGSNLTGYIKHIFSAEMILPLDGEQLFRVYSLTIDTFFHLMGPIFLIAIIFGLTTNFLQVGFLFAPEAVKPKVSNINPVEGLKRMFSKKALVEFGKVTLKITVVGLVVFTLVKKNFQQLFFITDTSIPAIVAFLANIIFKICAGAALIFILIAILDLLYQKWEFRQKLKMSKYEVKQEMKQTEGDPLIKSKIKEKQRAISMRRMMQSVPEATVVVTNPTHLAVALKYDEEVMEAPQVVAKGTGYLAEKIKNKAYEHDVPVMENKEVARALYASVEVGDYIPIELYQAVAEIIAHIYRIKEKMRREG